MRCSMKGMYYNGSGSIITRVYRGWSKFYFLSNKLRIEGEWNTWGVKQWERNWSRKQTC